ncbi:radical SAM protein [Yoonia sp. I 8.24]|nr:radical SAM protein [Yoonia sp. I 8.24]
MLSQTPVVQIHISRFCNYRCLHCYSSSGPHQKESLKIPDVLAWTASLFASGYRRVCLSGGEPTLASGFLELANGLSDQGYRVSMITNGSRVQTVLDAMNTGAVQHTSVSFDGPKALHDQIRAKAGAFDRALSTIKTLAQSGLSCGVVPRDSSVIGGV